MPSRHTDLPQATASTPQHCVPAGPLLPRNFSKNMGGQSPPPGSPLKPQGYLNALTLGPLSLRMGAACTYRPLIFEEWALDQLHENPQGFKAQLPGPEARGLRVRKLPGTSSPGTCCGSSLRTTGPNLQGTGRAFPALCPLLPALGIGPEGRVDSASSTDLGPPGQDRPGTPC